MDEISEPLWSPFRVLVLPGTVGGHIESPLSDEGARVGRHVGQVVHDDEHLDNGAERVEERHLDGTALRHIVPLPAQVDVTLLATTNQLVTPQIHTFSGGGILPSRARRPCRCRPACKKRRSRVRPGAAVRTSRLRRAPP